MTSIAAKRRHPAAIAVVLLLGLIITGGLYAAFAPKDASAAPDNSQAIAAGHKLFLSNCATCHGLEAAGGDGGPSLVGVGAAAVDFQVGTGRMPLANPGVQAQHGIIVQFSTNEISQLAAYVASLAPGPAIPPADLTSGGGDIAKGGELFRVNCAMCHNFAGSGGALTRGKYAPDLMDVSGKHIYEAMLTGPESMPIFNDANLSPQDKKDIISFLMNVKTESSPGGWSLGNLGPVPEGLFAWTIGIGMMIAVAVWLGKKAA
ncbi:c-type cytochrome [Rudaeicoccus suwonensis]|uniref:Cytochrome bc1 complex cytochrome c subunit n=1 Tax=Rudaeicoccus suwonensis TaxID=657409 RepID=A0A561EBP9_9MICO|nr:c-type cytochrome [Rudaeicoccus suwonensis]TWE13022.1 menaquinol-cytochrome c reductase cytochrome c1 subunit precursor [Rudaeicoccus suwonensis]